MKRKLRVLATSWAAALLLSGTPAAQAWAPEEPLQIAKRFVGKGQWPRMKNYLCCEAAQQAKAHTLGQQIPANLQRECRLLQQNNASAVVAVELRDTATTADFYLHFVKEADDWKLQAVRGLASTNLGRQMLQLMEGMPAAEVSRYNQSHPDADHTFTVGNLKLWVGADAQIIEHFNRNRAGFDDVVRTVQTRGYFAEPTPAAEQQANTDPAIKAQLQQLYIRRLTRRATACGSCLEFLIGGVTNDTVGLLYQPNPAEVPAMSPARIIVIRPLGGGWYLYKTT
ncbi:hypothetical protein D3Y59_01450 [Hymenobacter oligotrophus]|uniref:Uncharacterized protein n=1 Tax=Hymenobacter oligotrophus TaxID=2319843 RepID=A0A3B7RNK7_9BACT|nr:hypothetical protein [Hymenobacter oligotrophus]AYA35827.1 hypothetical protein D3Y59_01450 [Hymenobacter oligotrophus]